MMKICLTKMFYISDNNSVEDEDLRSNPSNHDSNFENNSGIDEEDHLQFGNNKERGCR